MAERLQLQSKKRRDYRNSFKLFLGKKRMRKLEKYPIYSQGKAGEIPLSEVELKICPMYAERRAEEIPLPGVDSIICSLEACPYNNGKTFHWEGDPITVCKSKGLIKKVLLVN